MNSNIDLNSFRGSAAALPQSLVSPPRRIFARYVVPGALLTALLGVVGYSARESLVSRTSVVVTMPIAGESSVAAAAESAMLFQAPGWVEPDPMPVIVSALSPGVVAKIHVLEGQHVNAGDVVAELVDGQAKLDLRQAEAALKLKETHLSAARKRLEHPVALREAIALAEATAEQLQAEKSQAEQAVEVTRKEAQIYKGLTAAGASARISSQKFDLQARAAEATLKEVNAKIRSNDAALSAARERLQLRLEDSEAVAIAEAEVEAARVALERARYAVSLCRIESPLTGTIMRMHASPGGMVSPDFDGGARIASVYDPAHLQVRAEVPLADSARIRDGLRAEIRFEALPDRVFNGELSRIVHEADVQRNTLPVKVRLLDPDPALKPEMIARLQFMGDPEPGAPRPAAVMQSLFVPPAAIQERDGAAAVWIAGHDNRAHRKKVNTGLARKGDLREVTAGITPADKLIISDTTALAENSRISIKEYK